MAIHKEDKADLRKRYPLYMEAGAILALLLLILAFRVDIRNDGDFQVIVEPQEIIEVEEVVPTEHETEPPPPQRPPVPVEVPNDEIIEDPPVDFDPEIIEPADDPPAPPPSDEETGAENEPDFFRAVEEEPELIGGMQALQEAVEYPAFAKKAGIEGRVFVQFIVDEDGNVQDPQVLRGVHKLLDEAAVEAVRQMQFEPGKQRGKPVKVQMSLPVTFRLR